LEWMVCLTTEETLANNSPKPWLIIKERTSSFWLFPGAASRWDTRWPGFGAIAEDGSAVTIERATSGLLRDTIERIVEFQREEISRRIQVLRGGNSLPDLKNKTVILVDDGIAMGSTMRAAIKLCENQGVRRIVVAVPVTGERVAREIGALVDEVVVLEKPPFFRAVAQVYRNWYDVSDREVLEIMDAWRSEEHGEA
jgi:putative phosphoribosyl transferase